MLGDISLAANIYIVTGYTDMRKSIDGLCAIVVEQLKEEPNGHSIYLFCGKRCDRIKVLLREPDSLVCLIILMKKSQLNGLSRKSRKLPRNPAGKNQRLKSSSRISQPDRFWQIPCLRKIKSVLFVAVKC